jgi:hypothetical protein
MGPDDRPAHAGLNAFQPEGNALQVANALQSRWGGALQRIPAER